MLMFILPSSRHSIHPLLDRFQPGMNEWSLARFFGARIALIKFNVFSGNIFIATWSKRENVQLVKEVEIPGNWQ